MALSGEGLHPDFVKIRNQFMSFIKGEEGEGIARYTQWVLELGLDQKKPYGATAPKEAFAWVDKHVEFNLWKEDKDARYWKVEAAFPLESMNLNVYTAEELQSAARSLIGKPTNINHEYELPMGKDRRDTVDIVAAEFEDDIVECIQRVGREARCHKGHLINDLIEQRKIIHVSLEAQCQYGTGSKGECSGMYFSGLADLTKETLPGIPLTRMMPLESIMREAFKAKNMEKKRMNNETIVKEQNQDVIDELVAITAQIKSLEDKLYKTKEDPQLRVELDILYARRDGILQKIKASEQAKTQEKKGREIVAKTTIKEAQQQPADQITCPAGQHYVDNVGCVPDAPIVPTTPQTSVGTSPAPPEPVKAISGETAIAIDDKVGRLQAERKVKDLTRRVDDLKGDLELKEAEWAKLNKDVEIRFSEAEGRRKSAEEHLESQKKEMHDLRIEAARAKVLEGELKEFTAELEKAKDDVKILTEKYNKQLSVDLDLTRRLTRTNEDLVALQKDRDNLFEQLKFAKRLGKRIVKIDTKPLT
jgi:hypothetical protein